MGTTVSRRGCAPPPPPPPPPPHPPTACLPCVLACLPAVGCINVVPGLWQPEWVPATVLLYHPPMDRVVTVIFEDEGEPFRHAIDFQGEWAVCAYQKSCHWGSATQRAGFGFNRRPSCSLPPPALQSFPLLPMALCLPPTRRCWRGHGILQMGGLIHCSLACVVATHCVMRSSRNNRKAGSSQNARQLQIGGWVRRQEGPASAACIKGGVGVGFNRRLMI